MSKIFYSKDSERIPGGAGELYDIVVNRLKARDTLVAPSADHLCKRWRDFAAILDVLTSKGVAFVAEHTTRKSGESIEDGYKRDLRRAAIERAKASGSYAHNEGRPKKANPELAHDLKDSGVPNAMIAATLCVSLSTVRRYLKRADTSL